MTRTTTRPRPGFTLVELMVSAAICVLIMAILANCFQVSIDTMRHLKSTGDMAEQLRAASTVLRRDLGAEHFLPESRTGVSRDGVRVSDRRMDLSDAVGGWTPPTGGFFRAVSRAVTDEGSDAYLGSTRADGGAGHLIHMTSILSGKSDHELYYATAPLGASPVLSSPAAEVAYFLDPTPRGTTVPGGSVQLYQLIRRQRLVPRTDADAAKFEAARAAAENSVVSMWNNSGTWTLNRLENLVKPDRRLGGAVGGTGTGPRASTDAGDISPIVVPGRLGDDVLLSSVLSFEVKLSWTSEVAGEPLPRAFFPPSVTDTPFDTIEQAYTAGGKAGVVEVDTGIVGTDGKPVTKICVRAIQIRLRVWDPKLQNARQVTIVQDL
ncbi:MAG: prepilin-type N-terminal cleavage/methylation domain-containing protein [Gemmataceae bacterium]|nr:prepilin-type N-terminal cleavage/methylation domain-containing protein [Gemmataceae bacterium]